MMQKYLWGLKCFNCKQDLICLFSFNLKKCFKCNNNFIVEGKIKLIKIASIKIVFKTFYDINEWWPHEEKESV